MQAYNLQAAGAGQTRQAVIAANMHRQLAKHTSCHFERHQELILVLISLCSGRLVDVHMSNFSNADRELLRGVTRKKTTRKCRGHS